jgi:hypothetical protein
VLQGAAGDVNPTIVARDPEAISAWGGAAADALRLWGGACADLPAGPCRLGRSTVEVALAPPGTPALLREQIAGLDRVEAGSLSDWRTDPTVAALANVLNLPTVSEDDLPLIRYTARAFAESTRDCLTYATKGPQVTVRRVAIAAMRIGEANLALVAAEPFAATSLRIEAAVSPRMVATVGYMSRLGGYLPDDQSMRDGGYEVEYAWRFYRAPAPFAPGSEEKVGDALIHMLKGLDEQTVARRPELTMP